jgi:hypothetical protein
MAWFEGLVANRGDEPRAWPAPGREPIHRQWHSLAAAYRRAVAGRAREIRQMELDLPAVPALERRRVWEAASYDRVCEEIGPIGGFGGVVGSLTARLL